MLGILLSISLNRLLPDEMEIKMRSFHFPLITSNASLTGSNRVKALLMILLSHVVLKGAYLWVTAILWKVKIGILVSTF